jgi:hypothetical protein
MAFSVPQLLHKLLDKLADNIAIYADYQIKSGAQVCRSGVDATSLSHLQSFVIILYCRWFRYLIHGQAVCPLVTSMSSRCRIFRYNCLLPETSVRFLRGIIVSYFFYSA